METRKIIIVSSKTQRKYTVETNATTLGELKAECDKQSIDYTNATWFEGTSKTELNRDDSVLPHDIPYKGKITNNLVFRLTPKKKISSGMNRSEMNSYIKSHNLQDEIKMKLGRNYTNLSNNILSTFIERHQLSTQKTQVKISSVMPKVVKAAVNEENTENSTMVSTNNNPYVKFLKSLNHQIEDFLNGSNVETCTKEYSKSEDIEYSDAEIEAMFK